MATEITMPKLSDTMTEGRLISWKKNVGDKVSRGDILAEVETDKANMELESFSSGVLLEIRVKGGETVEVGTVIGIVGEEGEKPASAPAKPAAPEPAKEPAPEPVKEPSAEVERAMEEQEKEKHEPLESVPPAPPQIVPPETGGKAGEAGRPEAKPEAPAEAEAAAPEMERASPLVRRLAREQGIDLKQVKGSGPEGRILQEDLEKYRPGQTEKREGVPAAGAPAGEPAPLSRMRSAIAATVIESWREIPHFTVTVRIDMGEAEALNRSLKESGRKISINDWIVKAAAMTLGKYPLVNSSFSDGKIVTHAEINIGMAVSLEEGLVVPVIKGCEQLSLQQIAERSREMIEAARSGKIRESDISGGTFSVSNLGMFGTEHFTAIIVPPQGAILAVGAIADQPAVKNGQIVSARMMKATMSADHRLLDGAMAARFLSELKRILENPVGMLL